MSHTPTIAIVDDDDAVREALSDLLQVYSFTSRAFDSAEAFLAVYRQDAFDCLITDLRMPGMGGLALLKRLAAIGSSIPVIVVTSCRDAFVRENATQNGAFAFLLKPIKEENLIQYVTEALRRPSSKN